MPATKLCRATVATAVATIALFAVTALPAMPADAAEYTVHEFNLANGNKDETNGFASADAVVYAVGYAPNRPIAVALSEVCRSQYKRINNSLSQWGYKGYLTQTVFDTARCPDQSRGNAIFVKGNVSSVQANQFDVQDPDRPKEKRDFVCMDANWFYQQWAACSTHLETKLSISTAQVREYAYAVQAWYGNGRTIPAGDFNIDPGTSALEPMRLHHINVGGTAATHKSGRKIDYVWVDKGLAFPSTTARITDIGSSDHHYFESSVHW